MLLAVKKYNKKVNFREKVQVKDEGLRILAWK